MIKRKKRRKRNYSWGGHLIAHWNNWETAIFFIFFLCELKVSAVNLDDLDSVGSSLITLTMGNEWFIITMSSKISPNKIH